MLDEAALIIKEQIERKESGEKPIQPGDVVKRLIKATSAPKSTPEVHRAVPIATASGKNMIEFTAGNARTAATIKLLPASDATRDEMKRAVTDLVDQFFDRREQKWACSDSPSPSFELTASRSEERRVGKESVSTCKTRG